MRSDFKLQLRKESAYENYKKIYLTDKKILAKHDQRMKAMKDLNDEFEIESNILKQNEENTDEYSNCESEPVNKNLQELSSHINNPLIAPQQKLPSTLYDLKNILQVCKKIFINYDLC